MLNNNNHHYMVRKIFVLFTTHDNLLLMTLYKSIASSTPSTQSSFLCLIPCIRFVEADVYYVNYRELNDMPAYTNVIRAEEEKGR